MSFPNYKDRVKQLTEQEIMQSISLLITWETKTVCKKNIECNREYGEYAGHFETLLNNRLLLKGIIFAKMCDTFRQEPLYIKIT